MNTTPNSLALCNNTYLVGECSVEKIKASIVVLLGFANNCTKFMYYNVHHNLLSNGNKKAKRYAWLHTKYFVPYKRSNTASVKSVVPCVPPKSRVVRSPDSITSVIALRMLFALSPMPKYSNI